MCAVKWLVGFWWKHFSSIIVITLIAHWMPKSLRSPDTYLEFWRYYTIFECTCTIYIYIFTRRTELLGLRSLYVIYACCPWPGLCWPIVYSPGLVPFIKSSLLCPPLSPPFRRRTLPKNRHPKTTTVHATLFIILHVYHPLLKPFIYTYIFV